MPRLVLLATAFALLLLPACTSDSPEPPRPAANGEDADPEAPSGRETPQNPQDNQDQTQQASPDSASDKQADPPTDQNDQNPDLSGSSGSSLTYDDTVLRKTGAFGRLTSPSPRPSPKPEIVESWRDLTGNLDIALYTSRHERGLKLDLLREVGASVFNGREQDLQDAVVTITLGYENAQVRTGAAAGALPAASETRRASRRPVTNVDELVEWVIGAGRDCTIEDLPSQQGTVTCPVGTLKSGYETTITVDVMDEATLRGAISATATVTGSLPDQASHSRQTDTKDVSLARPIGKRVGPLRIHVTDEPTSSALTVSMVNDTARSLEGVQVTVDIDYEEVTVDSGSGRAPANTIHEIVDEVVTERGNCTVTDLDTGKGRVSCPFNRKPGHHLDKVTIVYSSRKDPRGPVRNAVRVEADA